MSPAAQYEFVRNFNWDDGFAPIRAVLMAADCALETALLAFWRAEGPWVHLENTEDVDLRDFIMWLAERILRGTYQAKLNGYDPAMSEGVSTVQLFKLKKAGLPDAFLGCDANG